VYGGTELLKNWFQFREARGGHGLRTEVPYAIFQATQHKRVVESQTGSRRVCRAANWLLGSGGELFQVF
jgi:hypothetical protein